MTGSQEYIGGSTGGIPESVFNIEARQSIHGNVKGISGRTSMFYKMSPTRVYFSADEDPNRRICFSASVEWRRLVVYTRNRGYDGDPKKLYPDIYPRKLLTRAFQHFERWGVDIEFMEGNWVNEPPSDNFDVYKAHLDSLERGASDEDKKAAAFNTWTGQRALEFGFKQIARIDEIEETDKDPGGVIVLFQRQLPNIY